MSIGRRLASARAARGLELEDLSRATRIRVPILQALEADDPASAGPPAYVRGHLRTLAGMLGLDADSLLAEYERRHGTPAAPAPESWQLRDPAVARADRRSPSWLGAMVVTMLLVVGLLVVGLVVESPDDRVTVATAPTAPTPEPAGPASTEPGAVGPPAGPGGEGDADAEGDGDPEDPDTDEPSAAGPSGSGSSSGGGATSASGVELRVSVTDGRSWLEVTDATGRRLYAGVLDEGGSEEFTSPRELRVTVGDARAVRLEVDDRPVEVPGGEGDIARLRVRPGGTVVPA